MQRECPLVREGDKGVKGTKGANSLCLAFGTRERLRQAGARGNPHPVFGRGGRRKCAPPCVWRAEGEFSFKVRHERNPRLWYLR
jgi:hypothetical protein